MICATGVGMRQAARKSLVSHYWCVAWLARVGAFAIETSTRCIIKLLTFRRRQSENVDEALSRFETLRSQVRGQAVGFELPIPVTCWL